MKNLVLICLLAVSASGCKIISKSPSIATIPVIGMSEEDFKLANPKAVLILLSSDNMSEYKIYRWGNEIATTSDFYTFNKAKLIKFEQKIHYFDYKTVKVDKTKE
jgi:hypothetical protein